MGTRSRAPGLAHVSACSTTSTQTHHPFLPSHHVGYPAQPHHRVVFCLLCWLLFVLVPGCCQAYYFLSE